MDLIETVGTPAWDWLWSAQDWGKTERQGDVCVLVNPGQWQTATRGHVLQ